MDRQALADRIITYSDTVVAFALVNGFAFVISLGEPDIRCSIAAVSGFAFFANAFVPIFGTYALFWLRGYEARLRGSEEGEGDPMVTRFWEIVFWVRICLIWFFTAIVIFGIFGATQDDRCAIVQSVGGLG